MSHANTIYKVSVHLSHFDQVIPKYSPQLRNEHWSSRHQKLYHKYQHHCTYYYLHIDTMSKEITYIVIYICYTSKLH